MPSGPDRAIGGVVYSASAVTAPGVVEVEQPKSRFILGEPDGNAVGPRAGTLAGLITKGGISGEATPAIRTEIWNKLISNLAGGTLGGADRQCAESGLHRTGRRTSRIADDARSDRDRPGARCRSDNRPCAADRRPALDGPQAQHPAGPGTWPADGNRRHVRCAAGLAHLAGVEVPTLELLVALCKLRARSAGLYN